MAFKLCSAAVVATFALSALAMPTSLNANTANLLPRGAEGEPFTCPDPSATAAAKQVLIGHGAQGGLSNPGAGAEYGRYVGQYNNFFQSDGGRHMTDGMAVYWNVASM
ncbi:MAG: hypothetical protein Q9166_005649 [cf. Caloplaca sp. 2 TL-2023]